MKDLDEIIKPLLESAIRITEKIEENSSIDYACVNYFYDSEALDIGITFIMTDKNGKCERCYYSLLDENGELFHEIIQFLDTESIEQIVDVLYEKYAQVVSETSDFEIELEEVD